VDRILLRQQAEKDPRPIDPEVVAARVRASTALQSCRVLFDTGSLSRQIEGQLRLERAIQELIGPIPEPTDEEIEHIYNTQLHNFQRPEIVNVAHIVTHIDEVRSEEQARLAIEAAFAELERGESFAAVADRHSDCKGNGGDLGFFERGVMVEEFDEIVFALKPGERSPIFRTPFGLHIAEVRSKTSGNGIAEFKEVYDTIKLFLMAMRQQEAARKAGERLRAQAQISRISNSEAQQLASERSWR
jgi:peptidyl-prolyl cis-trans isomerase C